MFYVLRRSASLFKFNPCRFTVLGGSGGGGKYIRSLVDLNSAHIVDSMLATDRSGGSHLC